MISGFLALRSSFAASRICVGVRPRPRHAMDRLLEELDRVIERLGLHVLGERDQGGAAVAGSSMVATACGSDEMICSGRVMRSQ